MNEVGVNFLLEIGRRLSSISGDSRETSVLLQRVSVTQWLQRYNAIAFRGSFKELVFFWIAGWGLEECGLLGSNLCISRVRSTWGKKKQTYIINSSWVSKAQLSHSKYYWCSSHFSLHQQYLDILNLLLLYRISGWGEMKHSKCRI